MPRKRGPAAPPRTRRQRARAQRRAARFYIPAGMPIDHLVPPTVGVVGFRDTARITGCLYGSDWTRMHRAAGESNPEPIPCAPSRDLWAASNAILLEVPRGEHP